MSSITNIKKAIAEIKKITDQPHYEKLNNELKILIQRSSAFDEYINLLTLSKLYIFNVKYVVNQLYNLTGNESVFKTKIDSLSNNRTFNYDVIPLNSYKITKVSTYTYFDTFNFDLILSVLRSVSLARLIDIDKTQFFLPQSTDSVNEIAQNITTDYVNTILVERVNINKYLESIKTNASKLKVTPTPSTTPTSVATSSSKDVDDYIKEFAKNEVLPYFDEINNKFEENFNKFINAETLKENLNIPCLTELKQVITDHIKLVTEYQADILNFNRTPKYTQEDINETLEGLNKNKDILDELLNIAKGATQDSKPTPPASPTPSPTTPTTTTKPDEKKPEVPLTPEQWGIKFTAGKSFYMDLLPARQSTIPVQGGRDVPNAMPGLNYKLVTQVGKQPIPGFSPVYQNLGVKGMQVTIVGAFTGADGDNTRGTDTPIPKDSKDKTPTWINPKGSPSTSDNPGRGGKLPELSAYNSYTEFVQLCQQGKHMEVEINLFQVYKENIASKIGQDIKLQSTSGNPKFNGIVRSLDVYHATKERTWYTLVMDVTDFGMASKDPIDLNNELDEAVKAAQAELDKIKGTQPQDTTEQDQAVVEGANQPGSAQEQNLKQVDDIIEKINNIKDPKQRLKQELCFDHMIGYLKYIQDSDFYYFKDYISKKPPSGWSQWFTGLLSAVGRLMMDDITFRPKGNVLWVRARIACAIASFTSVNLGCKEEIYWKLDFNNKNNKYITRYTRVSSSSQLITPTEDDCEGDSKSFDSEISGLTGWNENTFIDFLGKGLGCGAALTVLGGGTFLTGGGLTTVLIGVAGTCAVDLLGEGIQATREFNKDDNDFVTNAVTYFFGYLLIRAAGKLGGTITNKIKNSPKQGGNVKGGSSNSPVPNSTINVADDIANILKPLSRNQVAGKIVQSEGVEYTIVNLIRNIDGEVTSVRVKAADGTLKTLNLNQIQALDITLGGTQPTVTTNTPPNPANSSTATSSQAAINTVSRLDKAIDDTMLGLAPNIKQVIKSKPNKPTILGLMKRYENNVNNPQGQRKIKVDYKGGSVIVNEIDTINFSSTGVRIQGKVIPYEDITNVSTLPNTAGIKPPVTPQPIAPTSITDGLINAFDNNIISPQAKSNLIANADDSVKRKVIELLKAQQTGTLSQYELIYSGNTLRPITKITVSDNKFYLFYSDTGAEPFSFTQDLSGRIRKVQSNPTSPPQNIPDNQSSSPTQQPSSGGGGSQGSTVPTPVGLTGKALDNYNKLLPFNEKQLAEGKEIIITVNREIKAFKNLTLKPGTQYKIEKFYISKTTDFKNIDYYDYYFRIKDYFWDIGDGYSGDSIILEDIVDIIIPN